MSPPVVKKEQTKDGVSETFQLVYHFGRLSFLGCLHPGFQRLQCFLGADYPEGALVIVWNLRAG